MGTLDAAHFKGVRKAHADFVASRREVIKLAGDAQASAKRAIFALHRDDGGGADALLADAEAKFAAIRDLVARLPELDREGAYRAGLEEYAEAVLYRQYLREGAFSGIDLPGLDRENYLGGLTDVVGELQRRQVRLATDGDVKGVKRIKDAIEDVVEELVAYDLGGYLRTKFDQAKNALRRAEDVLYDVSIRRK